MKFLQSLQGQVSSFQNFIKLLNWFSELDSLVFWGTIFHIFVLNIAQIEYHNE